MLLLIIFGFFVIVLKYSKLFDIYTLYHVVSALTCGGIGLYMPNVFVNYGEFFKTIFVFLMFIGGSTTSTAGGIKIQRFILIIKMLWWKIKEIILPKKAYFSKKFEGKILTSSDLKDISNFIQIYILFVLLGTFVLVFLGYGFLDSLFEVVSAQGNVGLTVGIVKATMPVVAKIMLIINMLIGRLEIIPLFAIIGFVINTKIKK